MADWADESWAPRFWGKVRLGPGCWTWTGNKGTNGYGRFWLDGKTTPAHRVALLLSGVRIPDGQEPDHLCRNKSCVNPAHLEIVTRSENLLRHFERIGKCRRGHPIQQGRLMARRGCPECRHLDSSTRAAARTYVFDGRHCVLCRRATRNGFHTCDRCQQQQRDRRARRKGVVHG